MTLSIKLCVICILGFFWGYSVHATDQMLKNVNKQKAARLQKKAINLQLSTSKTELVFDKKILTASPGAEVKLIFTNGSEPASGLQHNFVLVAPGRADVVANAGISAGPDKGYVPESADVLAHTKLLNPGKSETLNFSAPTTPGDYPYICTFPGHATTMRGVLKIK